ncbi:MAG: DUF86 domain-containing protein [Desulfamplus sp.]|nr:DUF86 domain-containing protein [Desulfamplus sp.]
MYDEELIREILNQILQSVEAVIYRFKPIKEVSDFTDSQAGMEKLDSICMKLIVIGESLKNIDKITNGSLLAQYPEVNWKGAKSMRDIISHHYFEVDAEIIFDVCKNKMNTVHNAVTKMLKSF